MTSVGTGKGKEQQSPNQLKQTLNSTLQQESLLGKNNGRPFPHYKAANAASVERPSTEYCIEPGGVCRRVNADVDLIASAVEVLAAVGAVPGRVLAHQKALTSVEDLQEAVSYSMATCSGLERHFEDKAVFDEIVSAIYKLKHEVSCQFNNAQSAVQYLPMSSLVIPHTGKGRAYTVGGDLST